MGGQSATHVLARPESSEVRQMALCTRGITSKGILDRLHNLLICMLEGGNLSLRKTGQHHLNHSRVLAGKPMNKTKDSKSAYVGHPDDGKSPKTNIATPRVSCMVLKVSPALLDTKAKTAIVVLVIPTFQLRKQMRKSESKTNATIGNKCEIRNKCEQP